MVTSGNSIGTACAGSFCPYETGDDWYDSTYVCGWDSSYMGYYTDPNWYAMDGYITTTDMYGGGWSSTIPTQLGTYLSTTQLSSAQQQPFSFQESTPPSSLTGLQV